jgi:hypothetical protein
MREVGTVLRANQRPSDLWELNPHPNLPLARGKEL